MARKTKTRKTKKRIAGKRGGKISVGSKKGGRGKRRAGAFVPKKRAVRTARTAGGVSALKRKRAARRGAKARSRKITKKARSMQRGRKHAGRTKRIKISASKLKPRRQTYVVNPDFEFFYELRDLILKSSPADKEKIIQGLNRIGRVKLAIISGIFLDKENPDPMAVDMLVVCDDVDRRRLYTFLRSLEADIGKEIKFAIMDKEDFLYRIGMFDRFVRVLLEGPHEKLIDKLNIEI